MSQTSALSAELSDEVLVSLCHEGDLEALDLLLARYRRFARTKARGYFLAGGDIDDIEQEGMIGLFKAIRDFRPGQSSFRAFAELCVTRQIMTAIKTACRQKHQPLNRYVSLWGIRIIDDERGLRGRGADEEGLFARPDRPSRCTLPITALRVMPPSSAAIWLADSPSAHNFFSISTRSSVQPMAFPL